MDEKRVNEIAELLNKKREEKPKGSDMREASEHAWPRRWEAETVKAIARAATRMGLEDVIDNFGLTDSEELAVILDAFSSEEVIAEAERFERAVEAAGEAFVSSANSITGALAFQQWRVYDWSHGVEALEIRPAVVDVSRTTGKEGAEAWSAISHFEFKHLIDNLTTVFDELEDFGYINNDEGEYFYADALAGSAITIRLFTEPADDAEAVPE